MKKMMFCGLMFAWLFQAIGAVSYTTPEGIYFQDFDSLPFSPQNSSLQNTVPWADDSTSSASQTSLLGWYLYHPTTSQTEGGINGHQRLRAGPGNSVTGAFYSFGETGNSERALGALGANTLAPEAPVDPDDGNLYIALRLHNDTGVTLDNFTLSYYAEQWHASGRPTPETMLFCWSTTATAVNDPSTAFTGVPLLGWTAPVTLGAEGAVDGNENRFLVGPVTVSGINWLPDTDLWLRWSDRQIPSARDDGMAIDDLTFVASVPEPSSLAFLLIGVIGFLCGHRRQA